MGLKQRSVSEKIDMINGSLMDKILFMAIPIALSSILQQLFNSVDVAVVGRFASDKAAATAAVGCNGPIINLIINLFIGISVGANVVIASHVGRGEKENANKAVHTSMIIAAVSGFILIFAGLITARPMHMWMNTPEEVMDYAVQYLCIYSLGMPFIMLYNFGAAGDRGHQTPPVLSHSFRSDKRDTEHVPRHSFSSGRGGSGDSNGHLKCDKLRYGDIFPAA